MSTLLGLVPGRAPEGKWRPAGWCALGGTRAAPSARSEGNASTS
ncbi:hypothetical protein [Pseudonocardia sp. N23]|nr:hypothetical protein [Pseudonocardia sp. N23]